VTDFPYKDLAAGPTHCLRLDTWEIGIDGRFFADKEMFGYEPVLDTDRVTINILHTPSDEGRKKLLEHGFRKGDTVYCSVAKIKASRHGTNQNVSNRGGTYYVLLSEWEKI